jgi:mannosyltransferase
MGKNRTWLLFFLLLGLSAPPRLIRLDMGFRLDEIITLTDFVRHGWLEIFKLYYAPNNHILFSLLAKASVSVFGEKEWALRLPSVILGAFTPPVFFLLLRRKFGEKTAFATGLMLAFSFWMVWFSQDARGYAGTILCSGLSIFYFIDWLETKNKRSAVIYVVCSALACWFHLYAVFIIAGQILLGAYEWASDRKGQKIQIALVPGLALSLGLSVYSLAFFQLFSYAQKGGREIQGRWLGMDFLVELAKMLAGSQFRVFALLCSLPFLAGAVVMAGKNKKLVFSYLCPALLMVLITFFLKVFIFPRFLAWLIPFFFLCVTVAVFALSEIAEKKLRLRSGHVFIFLCAVILVFLCLGLGRYYRLGKQGFKDAGKYISSRYPEKTVISYGISAYDYLYYDQYAEPFPSNLRLTGEILKDNLVVASHPWGWGPDNEKTLKKFCRLEKEWESSGLEDATVYLFKCD